MLRGQAQCDVVAGGLRNQMAAQRQFLLACTIGEKAVVADADEAIGQDVLQREATEKLHGIEFHWPIPRLRLPPVRKLTESESAAVIAVGDGDAMGVASQVLEHLLRPAEGRLGIHHPLLARS